ncbi:DAK2 domain-containing protein [Bacillus wiedmannii]|uniref:DAK2 domain-containing protein n=1 Tax=Bacillus wiedmannii TaxID=1890302 RepID=UPI003529E42B
MVKIAFEKGAEYTKEIVDHMGRAGTVGERSLGYPDAGAHALGVIFTEIAGKFEIGMRKSLCLKAEGLLYSW